MPILYAPLQIPPNTVSFNQQPRQGMHQPDFYLAQQQPQQGPSSRDFMEAQSARLRQRNAPLSLNPGSRAQPISSSISDPSNFQNFYKQLSTIKQIGQEQVARAQAESALARIRASQALNSINAANPRYNTTGGSGSAGVMGKVPSNPRANFQFAQQLANQFGWGSEGELGAWYTLGMKESGWNNNAQNPTSTAYGVGQFLNSTWSGVGIGKTSDPYTQVLAMAKYIKNRYGSPSKALAFHLSHNWY